MICSHKEIPKGSFIYAKKVEKAGLLLADAYQIIGHISMNKTDKNDTTSITRTQGK